MTNSDTQALCQNYVSRVKLFVNAGEPESCNRDLSTRRLDSVKQQHNPKRAIGILLRTGVAGAGGVGVQSALGDHFRNICR
jgi:hypothetical protein